MGVSALDKWTKRERRSVVACDDGEARYASLVHV